MAQTGKDNPHGPSIDAMLRGLTERPNVQSTLILSRKDGSIIRATGLDYPEKQTPSGADSSYRWRSSQQEPRSEASADGTNKPSAVEDTGSRPRPAEALAASVFQFVTSASFLGQTLGSTSRHVSGVEASLSAAGYSAAAQSPKSEVVDEESDIRDSEDEVQLLRLRIKHKEIIIFPDANYICCVVQRAGKAGNTSESRR
ncbi:hypothetical protein PV08_04475 [Exophiala spinifera]|uniref:Roadblock/LAMTOR2 domain-containing protein n=1 Tax=Exophiala spinifera TaxID=91928 RepID=A0A0D2C0S6_9EURO|nr:uncharacterized protein PV08_04475 [Exophiala spinifera]KIW17284.1 hypothetical protein PV08_04475 [Exophiala spinifera]